MSIIDAFKPIVTPNSSRSLLQKSREKCAALEMELKQVKMALALTQDNTEGVMRAREEFVLRIAEEIRVPLHGILAVCSEMADDETFADDGCAKLRMVCHTSTQMLMTLNELLQITTSQSGRMCMEDVVYNPQKLTDVVLKLAMKKVYEKSVDMIHTIAPDVPETLAGDVSRLRQCLLRLSDMLMDAARLSDTLQVDLSLLPADDSRLASMPRSKRHVTCLYNMRLRCPKVGSFMHPIDKELTIDPKLYLVAGVIERMGGILLKSKCGRAFQLIVFARVPIKGFGSHQRYSSAHDLEKHNDSYAVLVMEENPVFLKNICKQL
jgi:hypothetical protein